MGTRDPRVDAYIAKSPDFARPILEHLRDVVHDACPDAEETLKWSMPHFMYRDSILCGMAAFKQHCAFGFWRGADVVGDAAGKGERAMGQFGCIRTLADLPKKAELRRMTKAAMALNEPGARPGPRPKKHPPRPQLPVPDDLVTALARDRKARATFEAFPPSGQREYVEWITEAKTDATRRKRLATTLEWLAEGKRRNWKYER